MSSAPALAEEADGPDKSIPPLPDETWSKDVRITKNSVDDTMPQVVVDDSENAHFVWRRSGYWTITYDRMGYPMSKEVFITPHVVTGYGSYVRYPLGPQVAIDSNANIHVVWDDGWQNCYYQKFDEFGNAMTGVIHLGNEDNTASHVPAVAVDPVNDYVHVVHEDYEYQCEDIVYDKLDNNGKVLVNEVSVSADVSSHCEHCTLTSDVKGNIHVAFGTSAGAWWRKVDENGIARGHSVNMFSVPPYMITDLACTPNGDVHMVWAIEGRILYARLDMNGTKLNEGVLVSGRGVNAVSPRIAASRENNIVHVVWSDMRDGNSEIYYAKMEEGTYNETPENYRLTRDRASSCYPWIAVSEGDTIHVAWSDYRDGNWEIYYKYRFKWDMELNVVEYGWGFYFFHPNQTKTLYMYIENRGMFPDDYKVTLEVDPWAGDVGWEFIINQTEFARVPSYSKVYFHLSMTSPANASAGDFINVTVTATSLSVKNLTKRLSWRSFVIVEKAVRMTCAEPTKLIDPGGTVRFEVKVTNIGDVPDRYTIEHTLIPEDRGWEVEVGSGTLMLDVDENATFQVVVKVPPGAMTDMNASVYLKVRSTNDDSVWDGKRLLALVNPTFHIVLETEQVDKWVDPGDSEGFLITARNEGTVHNEVAIYLSSTETRPGWSAVLSEETLFLRGGEERSFLLTVTAPGDALAGSRQDIHVNAVSEDWSSRGDLELSVIVNPIHGLTVSIDPDVLTVNAGEDARFLMTVRNVGNTLEDVSLGSALTPHGCSVTFEREDLEIRNVVLLAKESRDLFVVVSTPYDAKAGNHRVNVFLTDGSGREYVIPTTVRVVQTYALDLSAPSYISEGPPGGVVAFILTLVNQGNGEDTFDLLLVGLPSTQWVASYYARSGREVNRITLEPGEVKNLDLVVRVPDDTGRFHRVDMVARAVSGSAEVDEVRLTLGVMMPDLRIQSIEYDPAALRTDEQNRIVVRVENIGSHRADDVEVVLLVNGERAGQESVATVNPGGNASVVFSWSPSPGRKELTFQVSCDMQESAYDNNEIIHLKSPGNEPPGHDRSWIWKTVLVLAVLLLFLLILRADYMDRVRGR